LSIYIPNGLTSLPAPQEPVMDGWMKLTLDVDITDLINLIKSPMLHKLRSSEA
jgi:hypothetical protein